MRKLYSLIEVLHEVSGVQKVLLDIHNGLKDIYDAKVVGFQAYDEISHILPLDKDDYQQIKNIMELKNSIVITHERKTSSKCVLLNKLFGLNIKQIHVQHSIYDKWRLFSYYPETIVSISNQITENLLEYFKISPTRIHKIHNGIIDNNEGQMSSPKKNGFIRIAYVARVDMLKGQIDVVKRLKGNISKKIIIDFIGNGPQYQELEALTSDCDQFRTLGYQKNVVPLLQDYDYVMLFSKKEGLPITLIEGAMCYKPLIINDVGGSTEIGIPSINAFLANDLDHLEEILNSLEHISEADYKLMAQHSRRIYTERFTYKMMIEKYGNLINSLKN